MQDPYRTLGLREGATDVEIKSAYRARVKEFHPDSGGREDGEGFRLIRDAYEMLTREQANPARQIPVVSWTGGFVDPVKTDRKSPVSKYSTSLSDFELNLTLKQASYGVEATLDFLTKEICRRCNGDGIDFFGWCIECKGEGFLRVFETAVFNVRSHVMDGEVVRGRTNKNRELRAVVRVSQSAEMS